MTSPYSSLSSRHFWKSAVSGKPAGEVADLWRPKFRLGPDTRIATAGSCFAQHLSRHLRARGFTVIDTEPPPPGLSKANMLKYGYSIYAARFGNIYTVRHLLQLAKEAVGRFSPADAVWERDGRFFDALRPGVEPNGLPSAESVQRHRLHHLQRVKQVLRHCDVLVFTLGLTEAWTHGESGTVYPTAPGTIAGRYRPEEHLFRNFEYPEIHADFLEFRELALRYNPSLKFLLTVSPVPLAATASDQHVLVAATYSKAVLRAVAGKLAQDLDDVDYFPSYEIVTSPASRGMYFAEGARQVTEAGVEAVMRVFFAGQSPALPEPATVGGDSADVQEEVVCEDVLLDAFAR